MDRNLAPTMALANTRTGIVAVDPNGAIFVTKPIQSRYLQ